MQRFFRRYFLFFCIFFLLVAIGAVGYFYTSTTSYQSPGAVGSTEAKSLAFKVGRLMILPTDETPTVATVSDPVLLKDQVFFTDAKVGDKVLIYTNAKKAILYDPILDKIVNIAPVNTGANTKPTTLTPASATPNEF